MRTSSDLRSSAARNGLTIVGIERVPMPGGAPGQTTLASRMAFEDPWAAARLLCELSDEDAADPMVRAWSLGLLKAASQVQSSRVPGNDQDGGPVVKPSLVRCFCQSVHGSVQHFIRFVREPKETFQSARVTMQARAGDCDDHARLVHALTKASGAKSRLVFFEQDGQPVHVVAQQLMPPDDDGMGAWRWAETTIPAVHGEHPHAAFARLRKAGKLPRRR